MTNHPDQLVERVARAVYAINPLWTTVRISTTDSGTMAVSRTEQTAVSYDEVLKDSDEDAICREIIQRARDQARAALDAASAWMIEGLSNPEPNPLSRAMRAVAADDVKPAGGN